MDAPAIAEFSPEDWDMVRAMGIESQVLLSAMGGVEGVRACVTELIGPEAAARVRGQAGQPLPASLGPAVLGDARAPATEPTPYAGGRDARRERRARERAAKKRAARQGR